ncbi:MAG TPA: response regulator [Puia sp.]|nr:response regulator [Puia sp.]
MVAHSPYLLLVDDDPEDREMLMSAFMEANPAVAIRYASDVHEGLQMLESCPPAELPTVLLIDYQMPGLNGLDLLQTLQANPAYREITKVMWSTSQRSKDMEDCKRCGASFYLIKPSTSADLDKVIHQLTAVFEFASHKNH